MHLKTKTIAAIGTFAWIIAVTLMCFVGAPAVAGYSRARFEDATYQAKSDVRNAQKLDGRLKGLGALIEGNIAEVGKGSDQYDWYSYEAFRSKGCFIGWRQTRESYEAGAHVFQEIQELTIPLAVLSRTSVRVDKLGRSAYVVSFTTINLEQALTSRGRLTRQDQSEDKFYSFPSGGGVYFENNNVARRVARALVLSISFCQKRTT